MLISDEYREQNRVLHQTNPHYGVSGAKTASMVQDLATKLACDSILDYGCGKQTLGKTLPHLMIRGYDPAIEGLDEEPRPADLVVCGDVMEHVEEDCVDDVLDHIRSLAKKAAVFVISTRLAHKTLPDGRNAHITVRDPQWWLAKLMDRFTIHIYQVNDAGSELLCVGLKEARQ